MSLCLTTELQNTWSKKKKKIHEAETDTYQGEMDKSIVTAKKKKQKLRIALSVINGTSKQKISEYIAVYGNPHQYPYLGNPMDGGTW